MTWVKRLVGLGGAALMMVAGPAGTAVPAEAAPELPTVAASGASPDFDGDGLADLAAAIHYKNQFGLRVWYGSGSIMDITQPDVGGPVPTQEQEGLRGPLLAADLDADGFDDLVFARNGAAGGPSKVVKTVPGSPAGLDLSRQRDITLSLAGVSHAQVDALALITAPVPRLAVGLSLDTAVTSFTQVQVFALDGTEAAPVAPLVLRPGKAGIPALTDWSLGSFGDALAAKGNRLFIGVPEATVSGKKSAGALVDVTFGTAGVQAARTVTQATAGVAGAVGTSDHFGYSLAASDGYLMVGTPEDDVESVANTGSVQVFRVTSGGLTPVRRLAQYGSAVPGQAEPSDRFGFAVALGRSCPGVTSVMVGGVGESLVPNQNLDGAVWIIPLTTAKGCRATQLYEGHGLSGQPHGARVGEYVAALRDAGSRTDAFAIGGGGSWSEGPIGELFRWTPLGGQSMRMDTWTTGLGGR